MCGICTPFIQSPEMPTTVSRGQHRMPETNRFEQVGSELWGGAAQAWKVTYRQVGIFGQKA